MPVSIKPYPVIKGEAARKFLARMKFKDERTRIAIDKYLKYETSDPYRVLEFETWENWYEQYYRNTLIIKPDDFNFDEGYW